MRVLEGFDWWKKYESVYEVEVEYLNVAAKQRADGVLIHPVVYRSVLERLEKDIEAWKAELFEQIGESVNVGSVPQIQGLLKRLELDHGFRTEKGAVSTSIEALETLVDRHPSMGLLVRIKHTEAVLRMATKVSSFWDEDYRVHPVIEQIGYEGTARVYTRDPNVNSFPLELREAVIPALGKKFFFFDWKAAELYLAALWAGCSELMAMYEQGVDIPRTTAFQLFGKEDISDREREAAKVVIYSIVFGSEGGAAARFMGVDYEQGGELVERFLGRYPEIKVLRDRIVRESEAVGYTTSYFGRIRKLENLSSSDPQEQAKGRRQAFNTAIQGSIADCMKRAMIRFSQSLPAGCRVVANVFDSFLVEVPESMDSETFQGYANLVSDFSTFQLRYRLAEGYNWRSCMEGLGSGVSG
jgi:DNA polymerase-1